ncbi:MAG: hypothetical protein IPJ00_19525 [Saprospirales bacterium]|nr:hypothetical protein [Saprospirales bacterium]
MVDNEEYRLANYVHNVSTIRAFQSKFGQDCENIDLAFKNASGKINWIEIPDLVQATPNASEELKDISLNNYRGYLATEFGNCRDAASCASFVSRLNGKFEAAELVKKRVRSTIITARKPFRIGQIMPGNIPTRCKRPTTKHLSSQAQLIQFLRTVLEWFSIRPSSR